MHSMTNPSQDTTAKCAAISAAATQASTVVGELSQTPIACKDRARLPLRHALTTPQNRRTAVPSVGSSLRRVHFSPHNEEFHTGMTPQSSPSRAQKMPLTRSILKRTSASASAESMQSQRLSSRDDQLGISGLLEERLPSSPQNSDSGSQEPAARVLFNDSSAFPQIASQDDEQKKISFAAGFAAIVEKLDSIQVEDDQQMALAARIYNELSGAIARYSTGFSNAELHEPATSLLIFIQRELSSSGLSKQLMLAVTKCIGCMLHIDKICALVEPKVIEQILAAVLRLVNQQFDSDKAVCQTAVWCISMLRVPAASLQPVVPQLAKLCSSTLSKFETSTSAQFECLSAIEALLRRASVATRDIYHIWLFSVFLCITSPIPGIRSKADTIIRHNIPWVAADLQKPEVDVYVQQFIDQHLGRVLLCTKKLLEQDEHILVARIWGMLITICAKHCMPKINDFLHVLEQCFNVKDPAILVATLMQWRCLIYAFHIRKQLQHRKYIKLVLRPITALLGQKDTQLEVRLACVRCWATMVYALGEHSGSLISSVIEVPALVQNDPSTHVREIVCRVIAALLNRFVLPRNKIPVFVLPQMIIGTTNLAAEGATSLANTHGPFSSESVYTGDHTNILSRYIVGLDVSSPTVPILVGAAILFVRGSFDAERQLDQQFFDQFNRSRSTKQQDYISFGGLCVVLATTLAQLEARSSSASSNLNAVPPITADQKEDCALRVDTSQLCDIFFNNSQVDDIARGLCLRLRTMLFGAINMHLRPVLDVPSITSNSLIKSNLTAPSFDISADILARFELYKEKSCFSYRFGLDAVNLVSTLHYSYMVASKDGLSSAENGLALKIVPILDMLYGNLPSEQEDDEDDDGISSSNFDIALMILAFISRVISGRTREDAQSSSAQEVLVTIMNYIANRLGESICEDLAIARLLVGELLAIFSKLPLKAHKALIRIVENCRSLFISETSKVWSLINELLSAIMNGERLLIVDDGFIHLFVTLVRDLPLPEIVAASSRGEILRFFEIIARLGAMSVKRWADEHSLHDLSEICKDGESNFAEDDECFARVYKLLEYTERCVRDVQADVLDSGACQLFRALIYMLHYLCISESDSLCRPFDEKNHMDTAGTIRAVAKAHVTDHVHNICEQLLKLQRVSNSTVQVQNPTSDDAEKPQCSSVQTKRSLSTMLDGDMDELGTDSCSSFSSGPQSLAETESESESEPNLEETVAGDLHISMTALKESASADSACSLADSTGDIDSTDAPLSNSISTPKRKKKKRGRRKQSVVPLNPEQNSGNMVSYISVPDPCTWSTVDNALNWLEEEIGNGPCSTDLSRLLYIQSRLADIQVMVCKEITRRF